MPHRSVTVTAALLVALAVPGISPTAASAASVPDGRQLVASQAQRTAALRAHRLELRHALKHGRSLTAVLLKAPGRHPVKAPAPAPTATPTTTPTTTPTATPTAPTVAPAPVVTSGNPFAGKTFSVTANNEYSRAADAVRTSNPAMAKGLDFMAGQSTARWWGDWNSTSTLRADVAQDVAAATANGSVPVYVVYDIMKRDGSGYSAGGAASLADYKAWIDEFVAGVGAHQPLVVVEPDAVNDLYNMTGTTRTERDAALTYALSAMKAAGIPAYLDAGGPSIHSPSIAAQLLNEAGVAQAQGFSVNVSNFQTTADDVAWGNQVSALVGDKHFVVDTSRNGNGSISPSTDPEYWCNPPGRALGHVPTTATGSALVDALTWIKAPGESDGTCRGFASAGTFSPDYAYGLYSAMS